MAIQLQPSERDPQRIVDAIIQLVNGRQNSVGDATLAVGATSTVVNFVNCSKGCRVFLGGLNSAAVAAGPQVAVADISQGSFVIRHASAGASAKLSFVCIGG
jgi:hypothetical protein